MAETYYKLATWCPRTLCFKDGKRGYPSEDAAKAAARKQGLYRVSAVCPDGHRIDCQPFSIADDPLAWAARSIAHKPKYPPHATRPMGGRPH